MIIDMTYNLVLIFIQHGLWPLTILIIILKFRKPLDRFLNCADSVTFPGGTKICVDQKNLEVYKECDFVNKLKLDESKLTKDPDLQVMLNMVREGLDNKEIHLESLVNILISNQRALFFEKIYQCIYDSQLAFLENINNGVIYTKDNLKKSRKPIGGKNGFDEWLGFLLDINFVDDTKENLIITKRGKLFLEYLDDCKYPRRRGLHEEEVLK
jgi:hypothetical protein